MTQFVVGILLWCLLAVPSALAFRMAKPQNFTEWTPNAFTQLNIILESLWNITNGRYQMDTVTTTPQAVRLGDKGEMVFFDTGTDQLCVNVNGIRNWSCVNLTPL